MHRKTSVNVWSNVTAELQWKIYSQTFTEQWDRLKVSHLAEHKSRTVEDRSAEQEEDPDIVNKSCSSCKNGPLCCYEILRGFNMSTSTWACIQVHTDPLSDLSVACERTSSTLKFIQSRLRSSLSANQLEMLMATERHLYDVGLRHCHWQGCWEEGMMEVRWSSWNNVSFKPEPLLWQDSDVSDTVTTKEFFYVFDLVSYRNVDLSGRIEERHWWSICLWAF